MITRVDRQKVRPVYERRANISMNKKNDCSHTILRETMCLYGFCNFTWFEKREAWSTSRYSISKLRWSQKVFCGANNEYFIPLKRYDNQETCDIIQNFVRAIILFKDFFHTNICPTQDQGFCFDLIENNKMLIFAKWLGAIWQILAKWLQICQWFITIF